MKIIGEAANSRSSLLIPSSAGYTRSCGTCIRNITVPVLIERKPVTAIILPGIYGYAGAFATGYPNPDHFSLRNHIPATFLSEFSNSLVALNIFVALLRKIFKIQFKHPPSLNVELTAADKCFTRIIDTYFRARSST